MNKIKFYLSAVILSVLAVSSCGIRGSLETAPPVFGPARAKYETEKAQKAEEEKRKTEEAQTPKTN